MGFVGNATAVTVLNKIMLKVFLFFFVWTQCNYDKQ